MNTARNGCRYQSPKEERMKTKSLGRYTRYLLLFSILLLLTPTLTSAKTITYIKDYTYQASDADSRLSSRAIAMEQVKRLLFEELGTYLLSETEVRNFELTKDRILSLTAGLVMTVILEEKWDGKTYFLRARLSVDNDELVRSIDQLRGKQEQSKQLDDIMKITREALQEIEKLKEELRKSKGEKTNQERYAQVVKELSAMDWFKKGYALWYRTKNNKEAMQAYDKAIEIDSHFSRAYAGRAQIYNDWEQYQKALSESELAIKFDPNYAWGFNCRGTANARMGNYQKAVPDYTRAIELDPHNAAYYRNRSWANYWLKDYPQSVTDANKAIEIDPKLANAYFHRGRSLAAVNNYQEAMNDFDKAITLDPMPPEFFLHRGYTLLKLDKREQALNDIRKAASLGNPAAQRFLKKKKIP
jgi:tetratricopeptide (TPR) repeat protein